MLGLKPSQPESFPDLQFIGSLSPDLPETPPELIAAGFNSSAWRLGDMVVKATRKDQSISEAYRLLDSMRYEHETLEKFLGAYMPDTQYTLAMESDTRKAHVVTIQPFVEATALPEFLRDFEKPRDPLLEFLAKSREVFKAKKLMPDIANIEDNFNVLVNSNVVIGEDDEATPLLVDTTFGSTQRSRALGPLWTRLIYTGAVVADKRLRVEQR